MTGVPLLALDLNCFIRPYWETVEYQQWRICGNTWQRVYPRTFGRGFIPHDKTGSAGNVLRKRTPHHDWNPNPNHIGNPRWRTIRIGSVSERKTHLSFLVLKKAKEKF